MEIFYCFFFSVFSRPPFYCLLAAIATVFCVVLTVRSSKPKGKTLDSTTSVLALPGKRQACSCPCACGADAESSHLNGGTNSLPVAMATEKQTGASMMEQLVPEIRTHALSYLDYRSLCKLSMTNSLMRKAANDDDAWKTLYHKDFTVENDAVTPANGWKAYYAATRAIMNINAEFFKIMREMSLSPMSQMWLNADYVKCFHGSGEYFSGYDAVMQCWEIEFGYDYAVNFNIREVRARVMKDIAWVTMKAFLEGDIGPIYITNVFEYHNGRWYIVHHHCS